MRKKQAKAGAFNQSAAFFPKMKTFFPCAFMPPTRNRGYRLSNTGNKPHPHRTILFGCRLKKFTLRQHNSQGLDPAIIHRAHGRSSPKTRKRCFSGCSFAPLVIFYAVTSRSDDLPVDFRRFSGFFGRTSPLGFAPFFRVAKVRRDMLATG
ncbi:MAG: hypothetical protein LBP38_01470, partial [Desulfovibrio sp.]|nr:hypothetical protein [Desulfovibrio sp.]